MKIHVGCGTKLLPGFLNIDIRPETGADKLGGTRQTFVRCRTVRQALSFLTLCSNMSIWGSNFLPLRSISASLAIRELCLCLASPTFER